MHRLARDAPVTLSLLSLAKDGDTVFARSLLIVGVIACGLLADETIDFWGQTLTNLGVWALFLYWLRGADATTRVALAACVIYATAGEIFLSLVWGVYDYRLGAVPLFVPPGHALLFVLGGIVAARSPGWIVWAAPLAGAPFALFLLASGTGTLDVLLFAMFLACLAFGRGRKLYAVMFLLALTMELYGTWLGNWRWSASVPGTGLTAINPPLAAGAFYCVLDLLVVATVSRWPPATAAFTQLFRAAHPAATLSGRSVHTAAGT